MKKKLKVFIATSSFLEHKTLNKKHSRFQFIENPLKKKTYFRGACKVCKELWLYYCGHWKL